MNKYNLGKKIVVVGVSASGKSTFSRKLAEKTKLPVIHMDSIMWKPGWEYIGDEATTVKLDEESSKNGWIIEGYLTKSSRTFLFERADTIVYLDYSPLVSSMRYIIRWWKHRNDPRPELPGSPEKFSFKFLKLVWTKGETISLESFLRNVSDGKKIILKSPSEALDFLNSIQ